MPNQQAKCEDCGSPLTSADRRCPRCGAMQDASAEAESSDRKADLVALSGARVLSSTAGPSGAQGPGTVMMPAVGALNLSTQNNVAAPSTSSENSEHTATRSVSEMGRPQRPPPVARQNYTRWGRVLPLLVVGTTGCVAFVVGTWWVARHSESAQAATTGAAQTAAMAEVLATLPAGEFTLGLTEDNKESVLAVCWRTSVRPETECRRSYLEGLGEFPARTASFPELTFDAYEISNGRYEECVAQGKCTARDRAACGFFTVGSDVPRIGMEVPDEMFSAEKPAICATFTEAVAFCESRGMRLPTADEWERAARSGDDRLNPWGVQIFPGMMNWGERVLGEFPIPGRVDGNELTAPVDAYADGQTREGMANLSGNVAEWVMPRETDNPAAGGVRGGSYTDNVDRLRTTWHDIIPKSHRRSNVGFRCVR